MNSTRKMAAAALLAALVPAVSFAQSPSDRRDETERRGTDVNATQTPSYNSGDMSGNTNTGVSGRVPGPDQDARNAPGGSLDDQPAQPKRKRSFWDRMTGRHKDWDRNDGVPADRGADRSMERGANTGSASDTNSNPR